MLQAVSSPHFGVAVVAHNLGEAQRGQCMADARQAPAQRPRKLARAHLTVLQQQLDDGEGNEVSEHPAQTRLPVALFFHAVPFITFVEFLKPRPLSVAKLRNCASTQHAYPRKRSKDLLPIAIGRIDHINRSRPCLFACSADCSRIIVNFPTTKQRNGFRSRGRANGPSKSTSLFPRRKLRRTIGGPR